MFSRSKSELLEEQLKHDIELMSEGARIHSVRRLMHDYQVSQGVVTKALDSLERSGWIIRRPGKGIFRYGLGGNRKLNIAMVFPDFNGSVFTELEMWLRKQSLANEMVIQRFVFPICSPGLFHYLPVREFDIILVVNPPVLRANDIDQIIHCPVQVLFIGETFPGIALNYVDTNPLKNGLMAADYLYRHGCRRPAVLYSEPHTHNCDGRLDGFQLGCAMRDIPVRVLDTRTRPGSDSGAVAYDFLEEYFQANEIDFDSVYLICDKGYSPLSRLLGMKGIRIPEDVSVIGSDGNDSQLFHPIPLTTVGVPYQDYIETVYRAVDQLVEDRSALVQIEILPHVIERASVHKQKGEQQK